MAREKLQEYPIVQGVGGGIGSYELEMETRGVGTLTDASYRLKSGKKVVYLLQDMKGFTPSIERRITICGYHEKSLLGLFTRKTIRVIPEKEREEVKSELLEMIRNCGGRNPDYVDFWD